MLTKSSECFVFTFILFVNTRLSFKNKKEICLKHTRLAIKNSILPNQQKKTVFKAVAQGCLK